MDLAQLHAERLARQRSQVADPPAMGKGRDEKGKGGAGKGGGKKGKGGRGEGKVDLKGVDPDDIDALLAKLNMDSGLDRCAPSQTIWTKSNPWVRVSDHERTP